MKWGKRRKNQLIKAARELHYDRIIPDIAERIMSAGDENTVARIMATARARA